jgi:hypothetical protein
MTAHFLDDIPDDLAIAAEYGEAKLGFPREKTITMDKIDRMVSRRLLPSKDDMERVMRGACPACPERRRREPKPKGVPPPPPVGPGPVLSRVEGPTTNSKPSRPAAKANASPPSPASTSPLHLAYPCSGGVKPVLSARCNRAVEGWPAPPRRGARPCAPTIR